MTLTSEIDPTDSSLDDLLNQHFAGKVVRKDLVRKVKGRGGVIVIDRDGNCSSGFTTKKMIHGWIEKGGESSCRF